MKRMTKVLSLLLAVAMVLSLVAVNVAAADEFTATLTSPAAVVSGSESTVTMDLVLSNNPGITALSVSLSFDESALELVSVTDAQKLTGWLGLGKNCIWMDGLAQANNVYNGTIATVTFKVKSTTAEGDYPVTLIFDADNTANKDGDNVGCTMASGTIKVIEETNITSITAGEATVPFGADEAAVKAALPTSLKGAGQTTGGSAVPDFPLEVESWDVSGVNTNPATGTVGGTARATLKAASGVNVSDAAKAQAVANVTLTALTTGTIDATDLPTEIKVPAKNESAPYTTDELVDIVIEAIAKVTVVSGAVTAEYEPTVTVDNQVANVDDTATATLSVSGASANGKFNLASAVTKTVALKVVPNAITDKSVSWKVNSIISSNTNIEATVEYAADYADKPLAVTISDGTNTVTKDFVLPALPEDAEAGAKGSYKVSLGKLKDLFGTAPAVGTELSFKVAVDGADVAYEVPESGDAVMENTLKVVNASSGSGASGLPTGGSTTVTYKITVAESENGTATAPAKAAKGETVTITTTPAKGYKTDVITVKTEKGTNVPVTDKTFTMPAYNVTVTVTFVEGEEPVEPTEPEQPSSDLFSDVPSTHWAYDFVKEMKELGIVNGVSDTEFAPDANITRAEFAKMVAEAFGLKATSSESAFVDCTASDWYTPYVIAGTEAGILKGVSADSFGANDTITRQDICTVLGRVLDAENTLTAAEDSAFADMDQVADYAVAYVKAFVGAKVVNGYEDGTFRPAAYATRAEVCKILSNVLKLNKTEAENGAEVEAGAETETGAEAEEVTDAAAEAEAEAEADAEAETVEEPEAE